MLGFKVALTGLVCMMVGLVLVRGIYPGGLRALVTLALVYGGFAALLVGLLIAIWS